MITLAPKPPSVQPRSQSKDLEQKLNQFKYTAENRRKSGSWEPAWNKDELYSLNARVETLNQRLNERELDFERLKEIIEDNENDKFGFIYTVEEFLKNIDLSLDAPPTIDSVGKLSKKSDEGVDHRT